MKTRIILLAIATLSITGCVNIDTASASKIRQTMSFPLVFTQTVTADGISKETDEKGNTIVKAKSVTHDLSIGGFTRSSSYENVALKSKDGK